jgi:hypothetical protein
VGLGAIGIRGSEFPYGSKTSTQTFATMSIRTPAVGSVRCRVLGAAGAAAQTYLFLPCWIVSTVVARYGFLI